MIKQKNLTVETLRGFAILLVVVGHVIGSAPGGGMEIDFPSPWRYLYLWIDYIQMPLFTAIAGWVYALKPIGDSIGTFAFSKFKRLIVPMIAVATIYFLMQYFTPGTNNKEELSSIWHIYLFPYTIFWYLQALFLIFMAVAIVEKLALMKSMLGWITVMGGAYLIYISQITVVAGHSSNFFSFEGAMNQLPFFIAGIGIQRFGSELFKSKYIYLALSLIGLCVLQIRWFYPNLYPQLYVCLLPIWLVPTLIIAFSQTFTSRAFVFLGTYAYSIYLFHGFGTAGGRIILSYLGIHCEVIVFVISMSIAVLAPILADKILSENRYSAMILLGKKM